MPAYDYVCKTCGLQFEEMLPISRREEPIGKTPEQCQQVESQCEVVMMVAAPHFGDSWHHNGKKVDRGFRDRMIDIKRSHPGAQMSIPS